MSLEGIILNLFTSSTYLPTHIVLSTWDYDSTKEHWSLERKLCVSFLKSDTISDINNCSNITKSDIISDINNCGNITLYLQNIKIVPKLGVHLNFVAKAFYCLVNETEKPFRS